MVLYCVPGLKAFIPPRSPEDIREIVYQCWPDNRFVIDEQFEYFVTHELVKTKESDMSEVIEYARNVIATTERVRDTWVLVARELLELINRTLKLAI